MLELARKSGVSIYPIVLQSRYAASRATAQGQRRFYSEAEYSMRTLAQETGAQAYFPLQIFELKGIYASIAQELSSQYSLGYSPNNGAGRRPVPADSSCGSRRVPTSSCAPGPATPPMLPRAVTSAFHPPER